MLGRGFRRWWGFAVIAAFAAVSSGAAAGQSARVVYRVGHIRDVSRCRGQNAEVEAAADATGRNVYEEWIGCKGIGFARSTDGGAHFKPPISLPGSGEAWDPSVAVSPTGTVYAAFMVARGGKTYPVVASSFDRGASFPRVTLLTPPRKRNWGDRDFIAVGPDNTVYLTWDYGPSASSVKLYCPPSGSCSFSAGELNIVMQVSTDGGRSFGPMSAVTPDYPSGGADSAPLVVEPSGRIDVLYAGFWVKNRRTNTLGRGHSYFISSSDGGASWSKPVLLGRRAGSISQLEWWINGAITRDAAGNLYATWDTQRRHADYGWLSYSTDHGQTWSAPIQVATEHAKVLHIVQAAGGPPGAAYVGWLTQKPKRGYVEYLRTFSIGRGWLSRPRQISRLYGNPGVWAGDTFGIVTVSPRSLVLSWGSAVRGTRGNSEIFATPVRVSVR